MSSTQRTAAASILVVTLLLAGPAFPVSKPRPNLSGVWKLDRDLTTAPYVKDDTLVVRQTKQRVKFIYQTDGKTTGTDVFVTDGREADRYKTRIERAYYKATWKSDRLVIVTQHVLDLWGYQSYRETDFWTLDDGGKTLTEHLSDGKVAVYYFKEAAPDDRSEVTKEFRAVAVYSGELEPQAGGDCHYELTGSFQNPTFGISTFRLCLAADKNVAADPAAHCDPLRGPMTVTGEDGLSAFVMKVSGRYCADEGKFTGNYEVDADRITGAFNQHLTGGSGMVDISRSTDSMVLYGVLLYD